MIYLELTIALLSFKSDKKILFLINKNTAITEGIEYCKCITFDRKCSCYHPVLGLSFLNIMYFLGKRKMLIVYINLGKKLEYMVTQVDK